MEYDSYLEWVGARSRLDPSWLSLKAANDLPILGKGVTWKSIQVFDQIMNHVKILLT